MPGATLAILPPAMAMSASCTALPCGRTTRTFLISRSNSGRLMMLSVGFVNRRFSWGSRPPASTMSSRKPGMGSQRSDAAVGTGDRAGAGVEGDAPRHRRSGPRRGAGQQQQADIEGVAEVQARVGRRDHCRHAAGAPARWPPARATSRCRSAPRRRSRRRAARRARTRAARASRQWRAVTSMPCFIVAPGASWSVSTSAGSFQVLMPGPHPWRLVRGLPASRAHR